MHDVRPGGEVLPVHLGHGVRPLEVPGLGAFPGRQPGRDQHAAQPAVENHGFVVEEFRQFVGHRWSFPLRGHWVKAARSVRLRQIM